MKALNEKRSSNFLIAAFYSVLVIVLTISYILEVVKGNRTVGYLVLFLSIMYIPGIFNFIIQKKNPENRYTPYITSISYMVLYWFVLFTSDTGNGFTYIMPMILVLIMAQNFRYIAAYSVVTAVANIAQIAYRIFVLGRKDSAYIVEVEIQMAVIVLFCTFTLASARLNKRIQDYKLAVMKAQAEEEKKLLEKIQNAIKSIETQLAALNGNTEKLEESSGSSKQAMDEVCATTSDIAEAIQDQLVMTEQIEKLIGQINIMSKDFYKESTEQLEIITKGMDNIRDLNASVEATDQNTHKTEESLNILTNQLKEVQEIMGLITSIATQTNLLSLNASIEAARAGELGKGFAVVAEEIRMLSDNTADAVKEIQEKLNRIFEANDDVLTQIDVLVKTFKNQDQLIKNTSALFDSISNKTEIIYHGSEGLNESVEHLTTANEKIVDSISTLSASSEETTANATQVKDLNEANFDLITMIKDATQKLEELAKRLMEE